MLVARRSAAKTFERARVAATLSVVHRAATIALLALASAAHAQGPSPTRAIGAPNRGRLERAVQLTPTPHLVAQAGSNQWGTAELVGLIQRAAARLQEVEPGPRLLVGALSSRRGGRLPPHSSHQNGRDADLGIFVTDVDGNPVEAPRFVDLDESGCGRDAGVVYCIDARRTFLFIAELLADPVTRVQWILVAPHLRQLIMAAGRRLDADPEVQRRVEIATEPRDGSESHRSHLHVRIYCPPDDRPECQDLPPYQEWYDGEPPRVRARPRRNRRVRGHAARRRRARAR